MVTFVALELEDVNSGISSYLKEKDRTVRKILVEELTHFLIVNLGVVGSF